MFKMQIKQFFQFNEFKNKETQLFETLTKLDSIADLIKNSKEESSYLKN